MSSVNFPEQLSAMINAAIQAALTLIAAIPSSNSTGPAFSEATNATQTLTSRVPLSRVPPPTPSSGPAFSEATNSTQTLPSWASMPRVPPPTPISSPTLTSEGSTSHGDTPIVDRYNSIRSHVANSSSVGSRYQPGLQPFSHPGLRSIGLNLSTSQANNNRMQSARATLP